LEGVVDPKGKHVGLASKGALLPNNKT
jgi:hypothetical protein